MKISVFRIDFHTIRKGKKGEELSRTSPQRVVVAAETKDIAVANLPAPPAGSENSVIQIHTLHHDVAFHEAPKKPAGARQLQSVPSVSPDDEEQEEPEEVEEDEESAGG